MVIKKTFFSADHNWTLSLVPTSERAWQFANWGQFSWEKKREREMQPWSRQKNLRNLGDETWRRISSCNDCSTLFLVWLFSPETNCIYRLFFGNIFREKKAISYSHTFSCYRHLKRVLIPLLSVRVGVSHTHTNIQSSLCACWFQFRFPASIVFPLSIFTVSIYRAWNAKGWTG